MALQQQAITAIVQQTAPPSFDNTVLALEKSGSHFAALQTRVSQLEDKLADRREFFNDSVNLYNIGIHEFPNLIVAKILGYKDKTLLEISPSEKQYDGVRF